MKELIYGDRVAPNTDRAQVAPDFNQSGVSGGAIQLGAPGRQVGPSGQEIMWNNLAEIASGVGKGLDNFQRVATAYEQEKIVAVQNEITRIDSDENLSPEEKQNRADEALSKVSTPITGNQWKDTLATNANARWGSEEARTSYEMARFKREENDYFSKEENIGGWGDPEARQRFVEHYADKYPSAPKGQWFGSVYNATVSAGMNHAAETMVSIASATVFSSWSGPTAEQVAKASNDPEADNNLRDSHPLFYQARDMAIKNNWNREQLVAHIISINRTEFAKVIDPDDRLATRMALKLSEKQAISIANEVMSGVWASKEIDRLSAKNNLVSNALHIAKHGKDLASSVDASWPLLLSGLHGSPEDQRQQVEAFAGTVAESAARKIVGGNLQSAVKEMLGTEVNTDNMTPAEITKIIGSVLTDRIGSSADSLIVASGGKVGAQDASAIAQGVFDNRLLEIVSRSQDERISSAASNLNALIPGGTTVQEAADRQFKRLGIDPHYVGTFDPSNPNSWLASLPEDVRQTVIDKGLDRFNWSEMIRAKEQLLKFEETADKSGSKLSAAQSSWSKFTSEISPDSAQHTGFEGRLSDSIAEGKFSKDDEASRIIIAGASMSDEDLRKLEEMYPGVSDYAADYTNIVSDMLETAIDFSISMDPGGDRKAITRSLIERTLTKTDLADDSIQMPRTLVDENGNYTPETVANFAVLSVMAKSAFLGSARGEQAKAVIGKTKALLEHLANSFASGTYVAITDEKKFVIDSLNIIARAYRETPIGARSNDPNIGHMLAFLSNIAFSERSAGILRRAGNGDPNVLYAPFILASYPGANNTSNASDSQGRVIPDFTDLVNANSLISQKKTNPETAKTNSLHPGSDGFVVKKAANTLVSILNNGEGSADPVKEAAAAIRKMTQYREGDDESVIKAFLTDVHAAWAGDEPGFNKIVAALNHPNKENIKGMLAGETDAEKAVGFILGASGIHNEFVAYQPPNTKITNAKIVIDAGVGRRMFLNVNRNMDGSTYSFGDFFDVKSSFSSREEMMSSYGLKADDSDFALIGAMYGSSRPATIAGDGRSVDIYLNGDKVRLTDKYIKEKALFRKGIPKTPAVTPRIQQNLRDVERGLSHTQFGGNIRW